MVNPSLPTVCFQKAAGLGKPAGLQVLVNQRLTSLFLSSIMNFRISGETTIEIQDDFYFV
jgi:hypothetical protein